MGEVASALRMGVASCGLALEVAAPSTVPARVVVLAPLRSVRPVQGGTNTVDMGVAAPGIAREGSLGSKRFRLHLACSQPVSEVRTRVRQLQLATRATGDLVAPRLLQPLESLQEPQLRCPTISAARLCVWPPRVAPCA